MRLYEIDQIGPGDHVITLKKVVGTGFADPSQTKNLFKRLELQCSQIIDVYKAYFQKYGRFKYFKRGSEKPSQTLAYYGRSHEERKPKDSKAEDHLLLVSTMIKAGFKAHRGNSVFMRNGSVGSYGISFLMFPVDGFHFSFSPIITDLYSILLRAPEVRSSLFNELNNPPALKIYYTKELQFKQDTDLLDALASNKEPEVMMNGYYYALNERYMEEEVNNWLGGL